MEHKECSVSLVLLAAMLCVYCRIDFVKASIVRTEKGFTHEAYSKLGFTKMMMSRAIQDTSSRSRRSIVEKGDSGDRDVCAEIIWPQRNNPKKLKSPCPTLKVWVPKKDGFTEFIKVNEKSEVEGGFSIAIFCHALHLLPYTVKPIFKPFINGTGKSSGTYDQLVEHIKGKKCHAVAGDVTIRGHRAQHVDFTIPYLNSEVYVLAHASHEWNQTLWTFLKPFTWRLWITIVGVCLFTGVALAILEYREKNPSFSSPIYNQLIMVIWFPISTFFFQEGKIQNKCSKVVLLIWLSMIFIVIQIFTATLSSWLTLDQLRPRLPPTFEHAGYQDGSFFKDLITEKFKCSDKNLLPLKSVEEYKSALTSGIVSVVVDELPYIELFLAKYGSEYMKFGPINQESGIAFAFPRGSLLLQDFSRAVINVTESEIMMEMKKKYLGFSTNDTSQPNQTPPQSLDVQSFIGLFIFMGTIIVGAIITSEVSIMRRNKKVHPVKSSTDL
ncbi:glutamate receptor 3.1 [Lactuca sativa]|uniref:Ionotropic glutamate receptor C-terminal domain-containing protein n=1 Tax=Lactuca sativa TaxID=4236 RepID=A0A9R1X3M5_LACSA|nr:glutamate receptor 3.1 [Lactuca sativa]KAJ0197259.1 hypothetical protein LSAT_V11C700363420 [Lactuca sativa]